MTLESFKERIKKILGLIQEIGNIFDQLGSVPLNQRDFFNNSIASLIKELKLANNSLPMELQNLEVVSTQQVQEQAQQRQELRQRISSARVESQRKVPRGEDLAVNRIISKKGEFKISDKERKELSKELGLKDESLFDLSKLIKKKKKPKK